MKKIKLLGAILTILTGVLVLNNNTVYAATPSCRLTAGPGDVIVNFNGQTLFSNASPSEITKNVNIPVGKYKIIAETWDNHSAHGDQGQHNEVVQFFGYGAQGGQIFKTGNTNDIAANTNWSRKTFPWEANFWNPVKSIKVKHGSIGTPNYQSVIPICLKFQKINEPTPTPTPTPTPVNGQCKVYNSTYTSQPATNKATGCNLGNYSDISDTNTEYKWQCTGVNGGTTATCSADKTPVSTPTPQVQCNVTRTNIDEGDTVTYSASISSGTAPYTINWSGISGNSTHENVTYNNNGSYAVSVTITDNNGQTATDSCPVVVVRDEDVPNNNDLNISCEVSDTRVEEGDTVEYYVDIDGGDSPYTIDWRGDISGDDRTERVRFNREGRYDVSVRVTDDDGNSRTDSCRTVVVEEEDNDNDDLDVECRASDSRIQEGDSVTFTADVDGGDSPYRYYWSGDISGDDRTERVRFNRSGRYEVRIEVRDDDGNRASDTCDIRVEDEDNDNDDRNVNVFSSTNNTPSGNLASVDSVFLSSLPYTGPEDTIKVIGFILGLVLWSGLVGYVLLRNKKKKTVSNNIQAFKEANRAKQII